MVESFSALNVSLHTANLQQGVGNTLQDTTLFPEAFIQGYLTYL